MVLKRPSDVLGTCIRSRYDRRGSRVISQVCRNSFIGFPGPRKHAFAHPDIPRCEEQPYGHDALDTFRDGHFCRSFDGHRETDTPRPAHTRPPLGRSPTEARVIVPVLLRTCNEYDVVDSTTPRPFPLYASGMTCYLLPRPFPTLPRFYAIAFPSRLPMSKALSTICIWSAVELV